MRIKIFKQKRRILLFFIILVLYLELFSYAYADDIKGQKNVLIINSYHQGFRWTNDEVTGIIENLKKDHGSLSILVEYMDWKNHPSSKNTQLMHDYFQYKYENMHIDVLIVTDDVAFEFALKNRKKLFSGAPLVFCGVNQNGVTQISRGYDNFTGVIEEIDPTDTIEMALEINSSLKKIYILFDNSESGLSTGELVINKIKSLDLGLNTISLNTLSYEEIIANISNLNVEDSIILVTTYYSDANGKIIEFEAVSREISKNSSVPVYHLYDLGLNNGAFGGSMMSGKLQGKNAADMAIRILNGENPDSIPLLSQKTIRRVFDFQQLKRYNVALKKVPKNSEIINKPFSFFEAYKVLVLSALGVFIILISFVCILLFYINRIKKMKKKLSGSHEELTQIYEELAASDEELKQQFDEICAVKEKLAKSEERFRLAADGSNAVIWNADMSNMKYYFSDRWYELLGYEKDEIDESWGGWKTIIHPDDVSGADRARNAHLEGKTPFYDYEYRMLTKDGNYKWFNVRGKVLQDNSGKSIRFAGSLIDITERKEYETKLQDSYQKLESTYEELAAAQKKLKRQYDEILSNHKKIKATEERLIYLAYHDTLTGLKNKLSLYENSNKDIFVSADCKVALLFIDMDNFKYINDTMGHAFGDQIIIEVSKRLILLMKENCSIYRFGGDEFIIIVQNIKEIEDAEIIASSILEGFKEEFNVASSVLQIGLSIGVVEYPKHGKSIEELLKYADIAMYKAKEEGRNRYILYNEKMNEAFMERANIEKFLHKAMDNNEFAIHYQPQLDLHSNKITGLEALLRWKNIELGYVSPLKFIKVAEDTHFIIPLGVWVLKSACDFLKNLHKKGYEGLSMSVNVSMLQLMQKDFVDIVMDTLRFYDIEPKFLELEITESILMESFEAVGENLDKLKSNGVRIALDDFGKGYSSLSYLKHIPISTLKIDKSFVDSICSEDESKNLTGQIVLIGKNMGMSVIAEGVESQEQLDYLTRYGCNKIQGYLFSKPLPEVEIEELLKREE